MARTPSCGATASDGPACRADVVPSAVRVFAVDGHLVVRECLLDRDSHAHRYRYVLLDPVVPPVSGYVVTLAVHPHADGVEFRWSAVRQSAAEVMPQVESLFGDGTYGGGLDALRARFARG
ncbi:SRPBCC family protein [Streptomyces roseochromogenus]|uniref:Polyketide cyclase n=1 Tax=Streptomyces roseochromogenus subsp. oscitans DS 12.976 TaxID=1352936 RepID=V6L5M2_STRRC|nr:SRPBCC family protein [Streptomyces roseochromogenus]EST36534.1 hypothetical protein M878_01220 [Streptomyces roseochromogenus subsp. oscitans DS 12.976]